MSRTQYTVLEIQFRSVKRMVVTRIRKNFEHSLFLSKWYNVITLCWCKQPTSNSFQTCLYRVYLFKLYYKLIIILLTNNLTNICSEISKTWLVLWMVYTCRVKTNVKGPKEVEKLGRNECTLHRWPRSPEMSDCRRSYQSIVNLPLLG